MQAETQHIINRNILREFVALSQIEKLAAAHSQKIRLEYQDNNNIDGNTFFKILGDYLHETTGKYCI